MTKTENLNLPQWVAEDPFQREDFNEAFVAIDEGYNTAITDAATAMAASAVAYNPEYKPFATGTYTGAAADVTIELGFRPSFVLIDGRTTTSSATANFWAASAGNALSTIITFTDTGFYVVYSNTIYPCMAANGRTYDYIAFR